MKSIDIRVGSNYIAKVNMARTVVRVDNIEVVSGPRLAYTYQVTNLKTGRQTHFRSSQKFIREASQDEVEAIRARSNDTLVVETQAYEEYVNDAKAQRIGYLNFPQWKKRCYKKDLGPVSHLDPSEINDEERRVMKGLPAEDGQQAKEKAEGQFQELTSPSNRPYNQDNANRYVEDLKQLQEQSKAPIELPEEGWSRLGEVMFKQGDKVMIGDSKTVRTVESVNGTMVKVEGMPRPINACLLRVVVAEPIIVGVSQVGPISKDVRPNLVKEHKAVPVEDKVDPNKIPAGYVVTYTDAHKDYDSFGTRTVEEHGLYKGKPVRKVVTPQQHVDWQRGRYASGLNLAVPEGQWPEMLAYLKTDSRYTLVTDDDSEPHSDTAPSQEVSATNRPISQTNIDRYVEDYKQAGEDAKGQPIKLADVVGQHKILEMIHKGEYLPELTTDESNDTVPTNIETNLPSSKEGRITNLPDARIKDTEDTVLTPYSFPESLTHQRMRSVTVKGLAAKLKHPEALLDHSDKPGAHVIVKSRAGTGKTTTGEHGLMELRDIKSPLDPSPQQRAVWDAILESKGCLTVCFTAFSKPIADELQRRIEYRGLDKQGIDAGTHHSKGFKAVRSAFRGINWSSKSAITDYKTDRIMGQLLGKDSRDLKKEQPVLVSAVKELVGLCKQTLSATDERSLEKLCHYYDIDTDKCDLSQIYELVPKIVEASKNVAGIGCVDFNDMVWLPVAMQLPIQKYDLGLVDECLPGWTPIMLADGSSITIKEIVESNEEFTVRAYDVNRGIPNNCKVIGKQKILNQKPLVKIKVRQDHRTGTNRKCNFVICTVDHKIWISNRGWVEAGQVIEGDKVIVETAAEITQRGKITSQGRMNLATLQKGNTRGKGFKYPNNRERLDRIRGGNGRGMTLAEKVVCEALGEGWGPVNLTVSKYLDKSQRKGLPHHYKLDVANEKLKIVVEVDGSSHRGREGEDKKKESFLKAAGWTLIRVSNREAIQKTQEVICKVTGNCPKPATVVSVDSVDIRDNYVYDITVERNHNFYANGILVHNCQDLNKARQSLCDMMFHRQVLFGDDRQAIFGFTGADADSLPNREKFFSTTTRGVRVLPLTVTRRCCKAVVREARKLVPDFEAHPDNPEGEVTEAKYTMYKSLTEGWKKRKLEDTYIPQVKDNDLIICRCVAPGVSQCFEFLKNGRAANILGRSIGDGLIALIDKMDCGSVANLIGKITDWGEEQIERENKLRNPSEQRIINIQDKVDCLVCFCEGAQTVYDVKVKIQLLFTDKPDRKVIRIATIHKAKGLEADQVFFLQPEGATCPHPMAKSQWQYEQELNLLYTGQTRAINRLVYVR